MSCSNLNNGINGQCNGNVGGLQGFHYAEWSEDREYVLDTNGVVVAVYSGSPYSNTPMSWAYVEADNGQANLTEEYQFNGTTALGFNQTMSLFIPDNANPIGPAGPYPTSTTVQDWVRDMAPQNKLLVVAETQHSTVVRGPRPKCFLFGNERGGYMASGSKQSGVNYTDLNGYTVAFGAHSKEPMLEVDYMVAHINEAVSYPSGQQEEITQNFAWNFLSLQRFLGANVREVVPGQLAFELYVEAGDLITFKANIDAIWSPNCFSGGSFVLQGEGQIDGQAVPATMSNLPTAYTGTPHTITMEYSYQVSTPALTSVPRWRPIFFTGAVDPLLDITEAGQLPTARLEIFSRTQR